MSNAAYGVITSEYNVLDYIESSGTQYIDTGVKANQNTRVVIDHTLYSGGGDASVFGAWDAFGSNGFVYVALSDMTSGYWCYADGTAGINMTATGRHTVDADNNVLKLDDAVLSSPTAATFTGAYNMYLFAYNNGGDAGNFASVRIHSCQIYDSGKLIRDFIPVSGSAGLGLYDRVNSVFYANSGSNTFAAGAATGETIIGGKATKRILRMFAALNQTARETTRGYVVSGGVTRQFYSDAALLYTGDYTVSDITIDSTAYDLYTLTGSGSLTLIKNAQYWMCGGGANGQAGGAKFGSSFRAGGAGGAGGFVSTGDLAPGSYAVAIGAGGSGATTLGSYSASGGTALSVGASAAASGGSGGGAGGYYYTGYETSGGSGAGVTTYPFGASSLGAHCGGGGGGSFGSGTSSTDKHGNGGAGGTNGGNGGEPSTASSGYSLKVKAGGEKGGGSGGIWWEGANTAPTSATFYGSGGGGSAVAGSNAQTAGPGYQGVVYILVPKR